MTYWEIVAADDRAALYMILDKDGTEMGCANLSEIIPLCGIGVLEADDVMFEVIS